MITDRYDAFMDQANWPDDQELGSLNALYGWDIEGKRGTSSLDLTQNEIASTR